MSRKGYGGDPTTYQLRDMQRRITSLEKAKDRAEARLSIYRKDIVSLQEQHTVLRAMIVYLSERI